MSSTKPEGDNPNPEAMARTLFDEALKASANAQIFPRAPDPRATTYFTEPPRRKMAPADFDCAALQSVDAFAAELGTRWRSEGHAQLAAIAPKLRLLADAFVVSMEEDEGDVSPFVYAMF